MVRNIYKDMACAFVPVDMNVYKWHLDPLISKFIIRKGVWHKGCKASTDFIVAGTWWEAKFHFQDFPGLF